MGLMESESQPEQLSRIRRTVKNKRNMQLVVTTMASRIGQYYLLCYDYCIELDQLMIEIVSFFASVEKGGIRDL